jgi:hypothetical protein
MSTDPIEKKILLRASAPGSASGSRARSCQARPSPAPPPPSSTNKRLDEARRSLDLIARQWDEALGRLRAFVEA